MTYSSIMVHMVVGSPNRRVLRVVAGLAGRIKADVIGVAASAPMPVAYEDGDLHAGAIQADLAALIEGTDEAEALFRAAMVASSGNVTSASPPKVSPSQRPGTTPRNFGRSRRTSARASSWREPTNTIDCGNGFSAA